MNTELKKILLLGFSFLMVIPMLGAQVPVLFGESPEISLIIHQGTMTAKFDQVPLESVLEKINKLTGLQYSIEGEDGKKLISAQFTSLPLDEALFWVLAHVDHAITFDKMGNPVKVIIAKRSRDLNEVFAKPRPDDRVKVRKELFEKDFETAPVPVDALQSPETTTDVPIDMEIQSDQGGLVTQSLQGTDMQITHPPNETTMVIDPPTGSGMEIGSATEGPGMVIDPPTEGDLEIAFPIPDGPSMEILSPDGVPMVVPKISP